MADRMIGLTVLKAGIQLSLQDLGRFGYAAQGVCQGGAMDMHAHCWANHLLGNDVDCATLEITVGMAQLRAESDLQLSIAGADMQVEVDGVPVGHWCSFSVQRGQVVTFKSARVGMRSYLAVAGGFLADETLGSVSTVVRDKLGGLDGLGSLIQEADFLSAQNAPGIRESQVPHRFIPDYQSSFTLRVIESYQVSQFGDAALKKFYQATYVFTQAMDRMGARLEGDTIVASGKGIVSEGIALGAIQVTSDGQPIILLNDRQTLGGYPKIGCVARVDLPKIAQARPGDKVKFVPVSAEVAREQWRIFCDYFDLPN